MANAKRLAERIPAEYRKEILEMNMIQEAQGSNTNSTMMYLVVIYKNYIEPTFSPDCNLCCGRALDAFKLMLPYLVELEKGSNALNEV